MAAPSVIQEEPLDSEADSEGEDDVLNLTEGFAATALGNPVTSTPVSIENYNRRRAM